MANKTLKTIRFPGLTDTYTIPSEDTQNKVTSISSSSTDTQYPSAKAVYTLFENAKAKAQTVVIAVEDWNGGTTCTKSVTGVTETSIVIVDTSDGNVECTGQGAGTLTFTATSTPTSSVTVKVVIL